MNDPAQEFIDNAKRNLMRRGGKGKPLPVHAPSTAPMWPPLFCDSPSHSEKRRKVFTYYEPIPGKTLVNDFKLLLLWKENWKHFGFDPVVLSEAQARLHPWYDEMDEKVKRLPSVNTPGYERACYVRHVAYSVAGGGLCVDYDLFCYRPLTLSEIPHVEAATAQLVCFQGHIPSMLFGSSLAFNALARAILDYKVGEIDTEEFKRPHVSDMHILKNSPGDWKRDIPGLVKNFGELGWEVSPCVHWASSAMGKHQPKWKHIKELRGEL